MAIFITGDLHGDFSRFKKEIFYEQTELSKDDYVIVTGDFGGVWGGSPNERHWLDWLESSGALYRVNHRSWWAAELPSEEEYQTAQANLERHGWAVEYIITHCCPTSVLDAIGRGMFQSDPSTDFLEEVAQRCRFRHWFFGHYHMDGHMGEQFIYLYQELLQIDSDP